MLRRTFLRLLCPGGQSRRRKRRRKGKSKLLRRRKIAFDKGILAIILRRESELQLLSHLWLKVKSQIMNRVQMRRRIWGVLQEWSSVKRYRRLNSMSMPKMSRPFWSILSGKSLTLKLKIAKMSLFLRVMEGKKTWRVQGPNLILTQIKRQQKKRNQKLSKG